LHFINNCATWFYYFSRLSTWLLSFLLKRNFFKCSFGRNSFEAKMYTCIGNVELELLELLCSIMFYGLLGFSLSINWRLLEFLSNWNKRRVRGYNMVYSTLKLMSKNMIFLLGIITVVFSPWQTYFYEHPSFSGTFNLRFEKTMGLQLLL